MTTTYIIIAVVVVLVILAAILAPRFARWQLTDKFQKQYGPEYDRTGQSAGGEKQAQTELNPRRKHVATLNIRPLSASERYMADLKTAQAKFVDQPAQATVEAYHLDHGSHADS